MRHFCTIAALLFAAAISPAQNRKIALTGTVLTPSGPLKNGAVVLQNGKILSVGSAGSVPQDAVVVATGGIIAPGFIDLHNHMSYNVIPRWKPNQEFGARYDWQQDPAQNVLVTSPHTELVADGHACDAERYDDFKALAQGETSTVGSVRSCPSPGLTRRLDVDAELPGAPPVVYNVFPFQMTSADREAADKVLAATPHGSLLIHVSEGGPRDGSAAREFQMAKQQGFLRPGVSFIHGVAIPPEGFAEMKAAGVGFVWSPRSNIELYGGTAAVSAAHAAQVTMALAPDWSITGSTGMLNELRYASLWNEAQKPVLLTDRELVAMSTVNAAELVNMRGRIGELLPGGAADIIVLKSVTADAYGSLTHSAPQDLLLTIVGGHALFGDPSLLQAMDTTPGETLEICGAKRAFAASTRYASLLSSLTPVMEHVGRALAPLTECGIE